jgi:hypothetical protein
MAAQIWDAVIRDEKERKIPGALSMHTDLSSLTVQ